MAFYKVCFTLAILCASVSANFYYERFKILPDHRADQPFGEPWTHIDHDDSYRFASSEHVPTYSRFPRMSDYIRESTIPHSTENFNRPKEVFLTSTSKRIPQENKNIKKKLSPSYTLLERDSEKYKTLALKSDVPHCVEIKSKKPSSQKDTMICYKCKNPKNGALYEECSYGSPLKKSSPVNNEKLITPPFNIRKTRSHKDEVSSSSSSSDDYRKSGSPYRFSEKIFTDASDDIPTEYKNKNEQCEKVVKDSMICMVCKDSKTNGKYEQCSYVKQPSDKAYSYSKSSSYKKPERQTEKDEEDDESKERVDHESSDVKPVREDHERSYRDEKRHEKESEKLSDKGSSKEETNDNCKQVEKDSKTCTICKDEKTGGNYEKCSYNYQPNDKVYKFSRSKSFGYPQSSLPDEGTGSSYKDKSYEGSSSHPDESSEYRRDYSIPERFYESKGYKSPSGSFYDDDKPTSNYQTSSRDSKSRPYKDEYRPSEYLKSESKESSQKAESENCETVEKGSMTCKVCKDPKTGDNFEQCSYSYKPKDKLYSYSKSKSFGSPTEREGRSESEKEDLEKSREPFFHEGKNYDFSFDKKPYVTASDTKREFRVFPTSTSKSDVEEKEATTKPTKEDDTNFYDAYKKKAEIEKFLQEFQKENRSNCKKIMRDKMTCYQCVDDKGFQKEECAFATAGTPDKDEISYREIKEFQMDPAKKVPRSTEVKSPERRVDDLPLEPDTAASESLQTGEKPVKEHPKETVETEVSEEAEAKNYSAETRPVFDKFLGLTLPAYMLTKSEHEAEFDDVVASAKF